MGKLKNLSRFPLFATLCCSIVVICEAEVSEKGDVFVQRPFSTPPTLSPPPYFTSGKHCQRKASKFEQSVLKFRRNLWLIFVSSGGIFSSECERELGGQFVWRFEHCIGELPVSPFGREQFAEEGGYPL